MVPAMEGMPSSKLTHIFNRTEKAGSGLLIYREEGGGGLSLVLVIRRIGLIGGSFEIYADSYVTKLITSDKLDEISFGLWLAFWRIAGQAGGAVII